MSFPTSNNRHTDFTITVVSTTDLSNSVGKAVGLVTGTNPYTVALVADGVEILGELLYFADGIGTVRIQGVCTLPYTGATPTLNSKVISGANGNVRQATTTEIGNGYGRGLVLRVDTTNHYVDVLL